MSKIPNFLFYDTQNRMKKEDSIKRPLNHHFLLRRKIQNFEISHLYWIVSKGLNNKNSFKTMECN